MEWKAIVMGMRSVMITIKIQPLLLSKKFPATQFINPNAWQLLHSFLMWMYFVLKVSRAFITPLGLR